MTDSYRYVFASCTLNMLNTYMDSLEDLKDDNDAHVAFAKKFLKKDRFIYGDPVSVHGQSKPVSSFILYMSLLPSKFGRSTNHSARTFSSRPLRSTSLKLKNYPGLRVVFVLLAVHHVHMVQLHLPPLP